MRNHKNFLQYCTTLFVVSFFLCTSNYVIISVHAVRLFNASLAQGFSSAVATWYGPSNGAGSDGGACGFGNDVENYHGGMISAGNPNLFKSGKGCGSCYQVKCKDNPACSGNPVTVTITDECPGCTDAAFHFDLSGKAFGSLAKQGHAEKLRNAGQINVQFQRVPCNYGHKIIFKIDKGSNANYLAFVVEFISGNGDIGSVELLPSKSGAIKMQQSWGAVWKADIPNGVKGPFGVRLTTLQSGQKIFVPNAIPAHYWAYAWPTLTL